MHILLAAAPDTSIQVTVISTIGLVVVASIGVFTARITSGARNEARTNAVEAYKAADIAKDYAAALEAKDALIASLESRVIFLEAQDKLCTERVNELERRVEEHYEQQRSSALIEREQHKEISRLRTEVNRLKKS